MITVSQGDFHHHRSWAQRRQHLSQGSAEATHQRCGERGTILLKKPATSAASHSRDFIVLSLDGSRAVEDHLEEGQRATALSIVDHYVGRPDTPHFNSMTLLEFAQQYSMPKSLGAEPT